MAKLNWVWQLVTNHLKRYLNKLESETLINLGKTIEQWLRPDYNSETELYILRWIEVEKDKRDTCVLRLHEVFDEPNTNTLDFYDFSPVNPDEFIEHEFDSFDQVCNHIEKELNGSKNKFLNSGMCQDEYDEYKRKKTAGNNGEQPQPLKGQHTAFAKGRTRPKATAASRSVSWHLGTVKGHGLQS